MKNMSLLRRFGATMLAAVMAVSLTVPAFAASTPKKTTLTINNAVENATYRIVPLMTLVTTENEKDEIIGYEYTLVNNKIGEAVEAVIKESTFEAEIKDGTVTRTGFQVDEATNRVMFRVAIGEYENVEKAYEEWAGSLDGQRFMSEFADAVKVKIEGKTELLCDLSEGEAHSHTSKCYGFICGNDDVNHVHGKECFGELTRQTCEDVEHTHTIECVATICNKTEREAHTHTDECYKYDETSLLTDSSIMTVKDNATGEDGYLRDENAEARTISVTLDYGYYMVISGVGQRAIINTNPVTGSATIKEKNEAPSLTKKVYNDNEVYGEKNDGDIGDLVYFQAVIDAGTGLNHLQFVDTLSEGLTFVALTSVNFYPRTIIDGKGTIPFGPDKETGKLTGNWTLNREFYLNAMGGQTSKDTQSGSGSLLQGRLDWTNTDERYDEAKYQYAYNHGTTLKDDGLHTVFIDAALDGQTLTIDFDEVWLLSKRSNSTGINQSDNRDDYKYGAIYLNDSRVDNEDIKDKPVEYAKYNQYLGDMATVDDDGGLIVINYVARINAHAKIGQDGNENGAKLVYGNDPKKNPNETPEKKTRTYTYELDVLKYMLGDTSTVLEGAEFELRRGDLTLVNADGNGNISITDGQMTAIKEKDPIEFVDNGDGSYRVRTSEDTAEAVTVLVTNADGKIMVSGLDAGLYSLTETKAPIGYIKADTPFYAVIGSAVTGTAEVADDTHVVTMRVYVPQEADKNTFEAVTGEPTYQMKVANASGLRMPETGGTGTTIFYVLGGGLVLVAGVLLVTRKRAGRADD